MGPGTKYRDDKECVAGLVSDSPLAPRLLRAGIAKNGVEEKRRFTP